MKKTALLTCLLVVACIAFKCSPASDQPAKKWYKGNLHTHSYWSDGDEFPEMIMDWYKTNDYQFIALSDHNTLAEGDYWIRVKKGEIYQKAFQEYLNKYDTSWVVYRLDSGNINVKLKTYEEYRPLFEEKEKFLILKSEEITDRFENKHIHMNATNIQSLIKPQGGISVADVIQNNLDAVRKQREETGVPMIVHLNHPNFHYSVSLDDMIQLRGERFFEIFNGHPSVHNFGDSLHIGTEEMWDLINIAYLNKQQPLIYGLATDDSHNYHKMESNRSNPGRGWIEVRADSLEAGALIHAMENGDFYASSGVEISDISFEDNTLSVAVKAEAGISYEITFIGCSRGDKETNVLKTVNGNSASYQLTPDTKFVRAKVMSTKLHPNPIENAIYEMAWTQPVVPNKSE